MFSLAFSYLLLTLPNRQANLGGPYAVSAHRGVWSFVDGSGKRFWSFGVDCTGPGYTEATYKPDHPGYASYKLYPNLATWSRATLSNLRAWGFNSLGAWSDHETLGRYGGKLRLPFFEVLHLGAYDKFPWNDMFDRNAETLTDRAAREQIPKIKNDPYLVGYFSDNELGWWDDTLLPSYLSLGAKAPGRLRLIGLLRTHYKGNLARLKHDWICGAASFESIRSMKLRPGSRGRTVAKEWAQMLATRYYRLTRDVIRRYDKRHLLLGDRYCQYYTLPVLKAARPFVDVISTNYGAEWNNGDTSHYFLDTLHNVTGKPVLITEFYMCARENRSGNLNNGTAFPVVQTQQERAAAFKRYMRKVAGLPYTVGAHWFQFTDEPKGGREDGEDFNMGLVDIHGKPYRRLTDVTANLDFGRLRQAPHHNPSGAVRPPSAPPDAMKSLKNWDKTSGLVPTRSQDALADLYVARDADNLYVGLFAMDYLDERLYAGNRIPEIDRDRLDLKIDGLGEVVIRFGGKNRPAAMNRKDLTLAEIPDMRESLMIRIPLRKLKGLGTVRLKGEFWTHSHCEKTSWDRLIQVSGA